MNDIFITELIAFDLPIYVVIDGAIVPDIEKYLEQHKTEGRPLFRDTMDRETVIAGPWLLSPGSDRAALGRSVAAAREAGQGVFWLSHQSEKMLFRHLRKLGAARMPDGRILYFRHHDSDVLAAVVPLVDAAQAALLFGPAEVIGLIGGSGDGRTVKKPDDLPAPTGSVIEFEPWQIEALDERQRMLSRKKIASLMRHEYPEETACFSDDALMRRLEKYEAEGKKLNITSKA